MIAATSWVTSLYRKLSRCLTIMDEVVVGSGGGWQRRYWRFGLVQRYSLRRSTLQHTLVIRIIGIHSISIAFYYCYHTFMQLNCLHIQLLYLLISYYIMHNVRYCSAYDVTYLPTVSLHYYISSQIQADLSWSYISQSLYSIILLQSTLSFDHVPLSFHACM